MIAEVLTIGDELLRGEIVDSNKAHLSERLLEADVQTHFQTSVLDDPDDIADALRRAVARAEVVLISGGLGPTRDDITIEVLAHTFERKLVLHEPSLEVMRAFFARFGRPMSPANEKQAWFPQGATVLPNPEGTAPGCLLELEACALFCLPGVPRELKRMLDEQVLPRLLARSGQEAGVLRSTLLRSFGVGESTLEDELKELAQEAHLSLGFRTAWPDNFLRPVARGASVAEASARLERLCADIIARLGTLVYGRGEEETMERVVGELLRAQGAMLAVAESCTGGLLGERVSAVPGCSAWFRGGVVAYSDDAKRALLGVPEEVLRRHGAVSEPVARALAQAARERFGATFALSTTGIAGPAGGSDEKPVGTVFVGFASAEGSEARRFWFPFDRQRHRQITVQAALDGLRRRLLGAAALEAGFAAPRAAGRAGGAGGGGQAR